MTLEEKLEGAVDGIGLYGLSPPRLETPGRPLGVGRVTTSGEW